MNRSKLGIGLPTWKENISSSYVVCDKEDRNYFKIKEYAKKENLTFLNSVGTLIFFCSRITPESLTFLNTILNDKKNPKGTVVYVKAPYNDNVPRKENIPGTKTVNIVKYNKELTKLNEDLVDAGFSVKDYLKTRPEFLKSIVEEHGFNLVVHQYSFNPEETNELIKINQPHVPEYVIDSGFVSKLCIPKLTTENDLVKETFAASAIPDMQDVFGFQSLAEWYDPITKTEMGRYMILTAMKSGMFSKDITVDTLHDGMMELQNVNVWDGDFKDKSKNMKIVIEGLKEYPTAPTDEDFKKHSDMAKQFLKMNGITTSKTDDGLTLLGQQMNYNKKGTLANHMKKEMTMLIKKYGNMERSSDGKPQEVTVKDVDDAIRSFAKFMETLFLTRNVGSELDNIVAGKLIVALSKDMLKDVSGAGLESINKMDSVELKQSMIAVDNLFIVDDSEKDDNKASNFLGAIFYATKGYLPTRMSIVPENSVFIRSNTREIVTSKEATNKNQVNQSQEEEFKKYQEAGVNSWEDYIVLKGNEMNSTADDYMD